MGWKSTKTLTRSKAISLLQDHLENASNEELANALEGIGYGDNTELPYYENNFSVVDTETQENNLKQ